MRKYFNMIIAFLLSSCLGSTASEKKTNSDSAEKKANNKNPAEQPFKEYNVEFSFLKAYNAPDSEEGSKLMFYLTSLQNDCSTEDKKDILKELLHSFKNLLRIEKKDDNEKLAYLFTEMVKRLNNLNKFFMNNSNIIKEVLDNKKENLRDSMLKALIERRFLSYEVSDFSTPIYIEKKKYMYLLHLICMLNDEDYVIKLLNKLFESDIIKGLDIKTKLFILNLEDSQGKKAHGITNFPKIKDFLLDEIVSLNKDADEAESLEANKPIDNGETEFSNRDAVEACPSVDDNDDSEEINQINFDFSKAYDIPDSEEGEKLMFYLTSLQNSCSDDERKHILEPLLKSLENRGKDDNEKLTYLFLEMVRRLNNFEKVSKIVSLEENSHRPLRIIKEVLDNKEEDLRDLMLKALIEKKTHSYSFQNFREIIYIEEGKYTYLLHLICMLKDENYVMDLLKRLFESSYATSDMKLIVNIHDSENKKAYDITTSSKIKNFLSNQEILLNNDFNFLEAYNTPDSEAGCKMMFYLTSLQNNCSTEDKKDILNSLLNLSEFHLGLKEGNNNEKLTYLFTEMAKGLNNLSKFFMNNSNIIREILNNKEEDLKDSMLKALIEKSISSYKLSNFSSCISLGGGKYTRLLHLICMLKNENYVFNLLKDFFESSNVKTSDKKSIINFTDNEGRRADEITILPKVENFLKDKIGRLNIDFNFLEAYNNPDNEEGSKLMFYLTSLQNDCSTEEKKIILEELLKSLKNEGSDYKEKLTYLFIKMVNLRDLNNLNNLSNLSGLSKFFMNNSNIIREILNNKEEDLRESILKALIEKRLLSCKFSDFSTPVYIGEKRHVYLLHLICMLNDEDYVIELLNKLFESDTIIKDLDVNKKLFILNLEDIEGKRASDITTSEKVKKFLLDEIDRLNEEKRKQEGTYNQNKNQKTHNQNPYFQSSVDSKKIYHKIGNENFDQIIEKINSGHIFTVNELDNLVKDVKEYKIKVEQYENTLKFLKNLKDALIQKFANSSNFIKGIFITIYFPVIETTGNKKIDEKLNEEDIVKKINNELERNTWRTKELNEILKELKSDSTSWTILFYNTVLKCLEKDN